MISAGRQCATRGHRDLRTAVRLFDTPVYTRSPPENGLCLLCDRGHSIIVALFVYFFNPRAPVLLYHTLSVTCLNTTRPSENYVTVAQHSPCNQLQPAVTRRPMFNVGPFVKIP